MRRALVRGRPPPSSAPCAASVVVRARCSGKEATAQRQRTASSSERARAADRQQECSGTEHALPNACALSQVQLVSALTRCDSDCFYAQALSLEPLFASKPCRACLLVVLSAARPARKRKSAGNRRSKGADHREVAAIAALPPIRPVAGNLSIRIAAHHKLPSMPLL